MRARLAAHVPPQGGERRFGGCVEDSQRHLKEDSAFSAGARVIAALSRAVRNGAHCMLSSLLKVVEDHIPANDEVFRDARSSRRATAYEKSPLAQELQAKEFIDDAALVKVHRVPDALLRACTTARSSTTTFGAACGRSSWRSTSCRTQWTKPRSSRTSFSAR